MLTSWNSLSSIIMVQQPLEMKSISTFKCKRDSHNILRISNKILIYSRTCISSASFCTPASLFPRNLARDLTASSLHPFLNRKYGDSGMNMKETKNIIGSEAQAIQSTVYDTYGPRE